MSIIRTVINKINAAVIKPVISTIRGSFSTAFSNDFDIGDG